MSGGNPVASANLGLEKHSAWGGGDHENTKARKAKCVVAEWPPADAEATVEKNTTPRPANERSFYVYVDVDDTFVRSAGAKRIPMPAMIQEPALLTGTESRIAEACSMPAKCPTPVGVGRFLVVLRRLVSLRLLGRQAGGLPISGCGRCYSTPMAWARFTRSTNSAR
jgi:hypothetical protein